MPDPEHSPRDTLTTMTHAKNHEHCPLCNSDRTEIRHDRSHRFRYLKKDWILEGLEHTVCLECGASFNAPGQIARNNARFTEFEAATVKGISPRDIAALREKYMVSQEDAAKIFHAGKTAFSKWERGEVAPTGPTAVLLRLALNNASVMQQLAEEAKVAVSIPQRQAQHQPTFVFGPANLKIVSLHDPAAYTALEPKMRDDLMDDDFGQLAERVSIHTFVEREAEMTEAIRCGHRAGWKML